MLDRSNTQAALTSFKDAVVSKSRQNLASKDKNASGKLSDSLDSELFVGPKSFGLSFLMEDYGRFQDEGVNGVKKNHGSQYSFMDKMPPPSKLDGWIVRRGIAPRGKDGKFLSRDSIKFLIARSIFINGIKPSRFFTNPFEEEFKNLPDEIVEAYGLDIENFLKLTLNDTANNNNPA